MESCTAFRVDWFGAEELSCAGALGVCALPGAKRGPFEARTHRDMPGDLAVMAAEKITDVISLTTAAELKRHKCTDLAAEMQARGFRVHASPLEDGDAPDEDCSAKLISLLHELLRDGKRVVLQCKGGLGRACTVAALYLQETVPVMTPERSIERVRALRGNGAIQTVRQHNLVTAYTPHVLTK